MIQELLNQTSKEEVRWYINNTLKKYIDKGDIDQGQAEHLIDYFNSDKAPKRLKKMSIDDAIRKSEQWVNSMIKKSGNIIETEEDTEIIKVFNKKKLKLVRLVGENSYKREGKLMSHCVASYYGKDTEIYSLRDFNNNPHCTIELTRQNGEINQIKGKGNGSVHPKYIEAVLKCLKHLGKKVRESELTYLGYEDLGPEMNQLLLKFYTGAKFLTFNNKEFFYKYSILKEVGND